MQRKGEEGYTLLEVLVAFVILAGAVIMSFRIFGDGLHRLNQADRQVRMVTVAQELLTSLQLAPGLAAGTTTGQASGFAWTITLTRDPQKDDTPQSVALFHARIEIREPGTAETASYSVETHLLAAAQ
jgi:general secretion pathway protein I